MQFGLTMNITCGIYLFSIKVGKILVCHATRSPWNSWSIPKGLKDEDEDSYRAAARELYEETGIDIDNEKVVKIIPLEAVKYKKQNKTLESFLVICDGEFESRKYNCHTLVNGLFPEVDKWKWISPDSEGDLLHESQKRNLDEIIKLVKPYL